eukprot:GEMP01014892.1.p1 GENE.GEMP01014892.1~~GEMP01014892.1.p1  ORF type:complete len:798 (+),score=166.26 GEMP01014892.1:108-2501(+)
MVLDPRPGEEDITRSWPCNSGGVTRIPNAPTGDNTLVWARAIQAPCRKISLVATGNLLCFADAEVVGRVGVWKERKSCIIEPPAQAAVQTLSCRSSHVMICYDNGVVYIVRIDTNRSGDLVPAHCVLMQWPEPNDVASAEWHPGSSVRVFYTGCCGGGLLWYLPSICAVGTLKQAGVFQAADSGLADHADVRLKVTPELMAIAAQELPVSSKSDACSNASTAKGLSAVFDKPPLARKIQYLLRAAFTEDCSYLCGVMGPLPPRASNSEETQASIRNTLLMLWRLDRNGGAGPVGAQLVGKFDSPLSGGALPTQLRFLAVPGTARSILITACAGEVALSPFDPVPQESPADNRLWLPNGRLILPVTRRFQMDSTIMSCVTASSQQMGDDIAMGVSATMFFCPRSGDMLSWTALDLHSGDPAADHKIQSCTIDVGECVSILHTAPQGATSGMENAPRVMFVGQNGTLNACSVGGDMSGDAWYTPSCDNVGGVSTAHGKGESTEGECELDRVDLLRFTQAANSRFDWYLQNCLVDATQKSQTRCCKVPQATLTLANNRCTQVSRTLSEASQNLDAECRKLQSNDLLWNLAEPNSGLRETQDRVAQLFRSCHDTLFRNFLRNPTIDVTNDYALPPETFASFQPKAHLFEDMIAHETQPVAREVLFTVPIRLRHAIGSTMAISGRNEIKSSIDEMGRRLDRKRSGMAADFRRLVAPLRQKMQEVNVQVELAPLSCAVPRCKKLAHVRPHESRNLRMARRNPRTRRNPRGRSQTSNKIHAPATRLMDSWNRRKSPRRSWQCSI